MFAGSGYDAAAADVCVDDRGGQQDDQVGCRLRYRDLRETGASEVLRQLPQFDQTSSSPLPALRRYDRIAVARWRTIRFCLHRFEPQSSCRAGVAAGATIWQSPCFSCGDSSAQVASTNLTSLLSLVPAVRPGAV